MRFYVFSLFKTQKLIFKIYIFHWIIGWYVFMTFVGVLMKQINTLQILKFTFTKCIKVNVELSFEMCENDALHFMVNCYYNHVLY